MAFTDKVSGIEFFIRTVGENTMGGEIRLKYVDDLIKEEIRFAVPDYQRGYKWTTENINELLTDIITLKDGEEYCLMPIIVRPTKDKEGKDIIEIVDGQQRLTTLKLIIDYINDANIKCNYRIPEKCYNEIDHANKKNALMKMKSFSKDDLREKLLPTGKQSPFYFIWYEIEGEEIDAINTFNRVNSWKIPLKESELAKAHIFSAFGPESYAERRLANIKWTNLEKLFNDNDFFSFFTIDKKKEQMKDYESAHMDLLLEIWSGIPDKDREGQRYPIYKEITELCKTGADLLKELEDIANAMKFIHEDRVSYHLASYLLLRKRISVAGMVKLYMSENSYHGAKVLLDEIKKEKFLTPSDGKTIINREYVEGLSYWEDKDKLNDILTMYNICDALKNNAYYDFYPTVMHSKQPWTLEHIHAKNERVRNKKEIDAIISLLCKTFSVEKQTLDKHKDDYYKKDNQNGLKTFYDKILYPLLSGVSIDDVSPDKNSDGINDPWYETNIMNLALLPAEENSTFNNGTYLEKIEKLKSFDLSSYIPKCTLQCFSKEAFSESNEPIEFWTKKKGERYLQTIISTITECLYSLETLELATIDFESKALKITDHTGLLIAEKNAEVSSDTISNDACCLKKLSNILIPDFQRAYAQGRNTPQSREIIENFVNDIRKVLIGELPALSLDFIYGRKNNDAFEPYDGQQRLTTLFLVHLYILRKTDCEQSRNKEWKGFKLSYRTSIEAGRFIDALSDNENQIFFKQNVNSNKQNDTWKLCHLESQLYVDSQMLEDDAVKSMLRTLSVIDEKLGDINAAEALNALNKITFNIYDSLPDENPEVFYLRTNTRGLPLTPFENFRSKYEAYLKGKNNEATTSLSVTRDRMNRYFNWLYVHGEKTPDEKLMKLFISYFSSLYTLCDLNEDETEKNKKFVPFQYFSTILNKFGEETVMLPILNLLDFLTNNKEENLNKITVGSKEDGPWFSEKIRNAILNNTNSEYLLLVSFFFNVFDKEGFNEEKYKAYIRVATNLINNNVSIKGNRELYINISNSNLTESELLQLLENTKKTEDSRAAKTIAEEIKKLKLIQSDPDWRSLIEKAESTAFADGFIDYLFDDNNSKVEFKCRLENFEKYFNKKGVKKEEKEDYSTILQIAYIRMLPDGCNLDKVQFFNFKRDNWRDNIFAHPDIYNECITKLLTQDLDKIDYISGEKNTRSYKIRESLIQNKWFIKWMISQNNDSSLLWRGGSYNETPIFSKSYHTNICWDAGGWSYDASVIQNKQITAFFRMMWNDIQIGAGRFYIIDENGNDITNSTTYIDNKKHLVISAYYRNNGWIDFTYQDEKRDEKRDEKFYLLYQGVIVTQEEYSSGIDWSTASERSIYETQNGNFFAGNLKNRNDIISILERLRT